MGTANKQQWRLFEQWSATAFLIGGLLMVIDGALVVANIATGAEHWMLLGQAFVGAAWTAALIGLLGLYPGLADRRKWLSRVGAVLAVIGVVTFAVMAIASLAFYAGIPDGEFTALVPFFLPGVLLGSVLAFLLFGIATLRTGASSRTVGILLLILPLIVLTNFFLGVSGIESAAITLGIVIGDALVMLALGYVLRTETAPVDHAEPAPGPTAK